jgi:large subunit ribosomal protein L14e
MEGIDLGQIVRSKSGRDKDRHFIVVGLVDENYVLIADGDLRKISNPKKKKIKHLAFLNRFAEEVVESLKENKRINDADLRKNLQSMGLL